MNLNLWQILKLKTKLNLNTSFKTKYAGRLTTLL